MSISTILDHPSIQALELFLLEELPIQSGLGEFRWVQEDGRSLIYESEGSLRVCFMLIDLEKEGEGFQIRGIKQQEIYVEALDGITQDRLRQIFDAWKAVVSFVLQHTKDIEMMMPHDLFSHDFFGVPKLKTPQNHEDFVKAFLVKSRLGKWIGE